MLSTNKCRTVAVGAFALLGSTLAFVVGARIGNLIDHGARTVTIARMPVPTIAAHDSPAPVAVSLR